MAKQKSKSPKIKITENIVTTNLYKAIGIDPSQQSVLPKIVMADGCSIILIVGEDNQDTKLKSVKFKGFGKIYNESIKPLQIETIKVNEEIDAREFENIKSVRRDIDTLEITGGEYNDDEILWEKTYPVDYLDPLGDVDNQESEHS